MRQSPFAVLYVAHWSETGTQSPVDGLATQSYEHLKQVFFFQSKRAHPTSETFYKGANAHFPLAKL